MANVTSDAKLFSLSDFSVLDTLHASGTVVDQAPTLFNSVNTSSPVADEKKTIIDFTSKARLSFGGNYKVFGLIKVNTVLSAGKWVYIFPESAPSLCIGAQYTSSDGAYSFTSLAAGYYLVYAMDPIFAYNGKLYEHVLAVAM